MHIIAGWDQREIEGFQVAEFSAWRRTSSDQLKIARLMEKPLRSRGLYWRPHEKRDGQLWCPISEAPLSTTFANSRFLAPWLAENAQWAVFLDFCDMLWLADPVELFALADDRFAVMVVKRSFVSSETTKMDGQVQTAYPRKLWSSLILWNLEHPGNGRLTLPMVNELPGRDLHRFCWLEDGEIGELPLEWNWLAGIDPDIGEPKLVHYTQGAPFMSGYEHGPWSEPWHRERRIMDAMHGRLVA